MMPSRQLAARVAAMHWYTNHNAVHASISQSLSHHHTISSLPLLKRKSIADFTPIRAHTLAQSLPLSHQPLTHLATTTGVWLGT